jgi:DNA polymerase-1
MRLKGGEVIYAATAAKIYQVQREKSDSEMRNRAKTANFGIIYGISAFGLYQRLGIPRRSRRTDSGYFHNFPGVHRYMQEPIRKAREKGFANNVRRRRFLPDINSKNGNFRGMAERNAINTHSGNSSRHYQTGHVRTSIRSITETPFPNGDAGA